MSYRSWENEDVIDQALPHFGDRIDSYKLIHSENESFGPPVTGPVAYPPE